MEILFFNSINVDESLGGVERVITGLYNGLTKYGYKITTIYIEKQSKNESIPNQIQLPSSKANDKKNEKFIKNLISQKKFNIAFNFIALFTRHIKAFESAVIKSNLPTIAIYHNTLDAPLHSRPYLHKLLNNSVFRPILYSLYGYYQKFPFAHNAKYYSRHSVADVVLADNYKLQFKQLINNYPNELYAIPNPMSHIPNKISVDKKENYVLFVGRLTEQKNISSLLRIWSRIPSNSNWTLLIVGEGILKEKLKNEARNLGIASSVEFVGHQEKPSIYYEKAKFFVMTSNYEGWPMTILESQSYGCIPIIFNSFPAAEEIIKDKINGYLIENKNEKKFAEQLKLLINSDEEQLSNIRKQCNNGIYKYKLDNIIPQWIDLIEKYSRLT